MTDHTPLLRRFARSTLVPLGRYLLSSNPDELIEFGLQGTKVTIDAAIEQLQQDGKEPDFGRAGIDKIMEMGRKGAGKSRLVNKIWINCLRNAMDPDFPHDIRNHDLSVLDSLNESDLILLYTCCAHREEMASEIINNAPLFEAFLGIDSRQSLLFREFSMSFELVRNFAHAEFSGSEIVISDEEFEYAIKACLRNHENPDGIFLEHSQFRQNRLVCTGSSSTLPGNITPLISDWEGIQALKPSPLGERIYRIIAKHGVETSA